MYMIQTDHLKLFFVSDFSKGTSEEIGPLSFMLFCFNLHTRPSSHTLVKAFDMPQSTPLTSKLLSKAVKIS